MDKDTQTDRKYAAALPAVLHCGDLDLECRAQDLGREGVLLVGDLPRPDQPEMGLTLRSAGGDLTVYARGRLTFFTRDEANAQSRLGMQFVQLDDAQRQALDLLLSRVVEGRAPAGLESLSRGAPVAEVRDVLSKIPVAHRVALARRAQANERQFLRHDPDPHVLESLVRNPNIVLPEIIALARTPLLLPSTVEIMAGDPRWASSDELKLLLATHPRATFSTVDRMVARLGDNMLQRVIHRPGLNPAVREKVMRKLSRKNRG